MTFTNTINAYLELMRVGNPVGSILIFVPHLLGTLFAASVANPPVEVKSLMVTNMVLLPASTMLHAAVPGTT
jgi:4-hydroxybenzoate polyprenyltransferase